MMKKPILTTTMAGIFLLAAAMGVQSQSSDLDQAVQAVVRIRGCDASGCDRGVGSGVIIDPTGVILTANHVTLSDPDDPLSDPLNDFVIEMTSDWRAMPEARYRAGLAASDRTDDLALLQIYWDELEPGDVKFADLTLPALPLDGIDAVGSGGDLAVDLGERLHFLGYPLLGGATVNYLDLGLSGNDGDQDSLLKVPGVLSPGYSGGPALIQRSDGFHVIGIVIRQRYAQGSDRASGQVSLIRSVGALSGLDWTPAARRVWVDGVTVATVDSDDEPFNIELDLRALDFVDRPGRVMAYAYDAASGQPWMPQRSDLPTTAAGQVVLSADFEFSGFLGERKVMLWVPKHALVDMPDELAFRIVLWDTAAERAVWRDTDWRRPQAVKEGATVLTQWQWPLPLLAMSQATTIPTAGPTAVPTALPTLAATPIQQALPLSVPRATPLHSPAPATCRVVTQALRLRAGPGTTFVAKGMLDIGTDLAVLSRDPGVAWIEVRTQSGLNGWIYNSPAYVACDGAIADLPIGDIPPLPRPTPDRLPAASAGPTSVELLTPADGANSRDPLTFSWQPDAALAEGQVYELVFWEPSKGQDHERGGGSWQDASAATSVTLDPAKHAPETYAWGVWLGAFDANGQYTRLRYLGGGWSFTVPSGDSN